MDVELAEDPGMATFQMAALAPLGPADRQDLLSAEGAAARARLLAEQLADVTELLRARLGG
jgi:hypothetical protein